MAQPPLTLEGLTGIAGDVEPRQVSALLLARAPGVLAEGGDDFDLLLETIRGVATEVEPLVGTIPEGQRDTSARWRLGVWALTLGVAAQIEAALFPEQQGPGDTGRAAALTARYVAALTQLRGVLPGDADLPEGGGGVGDPDTPPPPQGQFPPTAIDPFAGTSVDPHVIGWPW